MKLLAILTLIILSTINVSAQKVKYKDLYVLLRAKNYSDGTTFLKKFLSDNPAHPNANYQMALMLEFKLAELDLLKQSEAIILRVDSSILYFDKAYTLINEKDVKKHDDDYYELFKRRNLRTGKFEVILSDVQLDIENRKNKLTLKKNNVGIINKAFNSSMRLFNSAEESYSALKSVYKTGLTLSLGASDSTVIGINKLIVEYDSSVVYFKQYKKLKKEFDSNSDDIIISVEDVENFEDEQLRSIDFYSKKVNFTNFSSWGNDQLKQIEKQHQFIDNLIVFDESLELIEEHISSDSVDLSSEVFSKYTDPTLKALKTLDQESALFKLLNYRLGQLNLNSALMKWFVSYADTVDVGAQLTLVEELMNEIAGLKQLEASISTSLDDQFWMRYSVFVDKRYQNKEKFIAYINAQKSIVTDQDRFIISLDSLIKEKDKRGYYLGDSIPLGLSSDSLASYHTFYADSLENRAVNVVGLSETESSNFIYFAVIPSSRQLDSLYKIETTLTLDEISQTSFVAIKEAALESSSLYLIGVTGENKFTLVHFYNNRGVLWNKSLKQTISNVPTLSYKEGKIIISDGGISLKFSIEDGSTLE